MDSFDFKFDIPEMANLDKLKAKLHDLGVEYEYLAKQVASFNKDGGVSSVKIEAMGKQLDRIVKILATIGPKGGIRGFKVIDAGATEKELVEADKAIKKYYDNMIKAEDKANKERAKLAAKAEKDIWDDRIKTAGAMLNELHKKYLDSQKTLQNANANKAKDVIIAGAAGFGNLDANAKTTAMGSLNTAVNLIRQGHIEGRRLVEIFGIIQRGEAFKALTREEERAEQALRRFRNTIVDFNEDANKGGKSLVLSFESVVRILQVQVLHRIFSEIINGISEGIRVAKEFEMVVSRIRTISQDNQLSSSKWKEELIGLSNAFNIELLDATQAAYQLISNQIGKGTDATKLLGEAFKFARITGASAKESVDLLSFSLNAFKIKSSESEKILAMAFKTIDLGNVTASELAQNFGVVAAISAQAGVKIEELYAGIATLSIQGIKADTTMTLFKNVIKELIKPSTEMKELLKEWGVSSGTMAIKAFGLVGVLQKLQKELDKGPERLGVLFDEIRALTGAFGLIGGENLEIFKKAEDQITKSIGTYREAAKIIEESPAAQLGKDWRELTNAFIEAGEAFLKMTADVNQGTGTLNTLTGTIKLITGTVSTFAAAVKLLNPNTWFQRIPSVAKYTEDKERTRKEYEKMNPPESAYRTLESMEEEQKKAAEAKKRVDEFEKASKDPAKKAILDEIEIIRERIRVAAEGSAEFIKSKEDEFKALTKQDEASEKFFKKYEDHIDKLIKKSKDYQDKMIEAWKVKDFEASLDNKTVFDKVDITLKHIVDMRKEAFTEFFNNDNIERARDIFEDIQKITERINKELRKEITKSLEETEKITRKLDEKKFDAEIRGKNFNTVKGMIGDKIKDLMGFATGTDDIDKARNALKEAERFAEKLNKIEDKKNKKIGKKSKKLAGDSLIEEVDETRLKVEDDFRKRAEAAIIKDEESRAKRIRMEEDYRILQKANLVDAKDILSEIDKQNTKMNELINTENGRITALQIQLGLERNITAELNGRKVNPAPAPRGFVPPGLDVGGLLHGPMGRDNLLIRAHAGEFVMNTDATKAWYPQLVAMNAGLPPRGYASGGPVTNVGDINITMQGQQSAEQDVREIGRLLRREIRRGNVRLT